MLPKDTLAHPGVLGESHSDSPVPSLPPAVVVKGGKHSDTPTLHPLRHAVQIFTDTSDEGWGAHLGDYTARGGWSVPESKLHINFLKLKAVLLALKTFKPLCRGWVVFVTTDNTTVVAYINKEGGMHSGSLCALLWRLLPSCNLREICLKAYHIPGRLNVMADKVSRHHQVIQMEWSLHPDVFSQICHKWHLPKVNQFQTTSVCVPSSQSQGVDSGCIKPVLGGSGSVCLSSSPPSDKCSDRSQKDDNPSSGLAEHALVLGSGGDVIPNPSLSSQPPGSQRQPSQGSTKPEPSCLAPRAKNIGEQGFSDQVATRIEAPQQSTRFVYDAKWAVFVRWCKAHQVDFH